MNMRLPTLFSLTSLSIACGTPNPGGDATPQADVPTMVADVPSAIPDGGMCTMGLTACAGVGCVDVRTNAMHCGMCGMACPAVMNGTAGCAAGACTPTCNMGFTLMGNQCVPGGGGSPPPRPLMPLSLGDVTTLRPALKWQLPMGVDGAVVELCRDRACTMIIETVRAMGSSGAPMNPLPAKSTIFWRVRATNGVANSPTWLFHTPAVAPMGTVDSSANPHLDVNGDGFDDLAIGSPGATIGMGNGNGTAQIYLGSAMGIPMMPTITLAGAADRDAFGAVASAGDVNGDGFGDLVVGAQQADPGGRTNAGTASIWYGSATGIVMMPNVVLEGPVGLAFYGSAVGTGGDLNGDGYADVVVGAYQTNNSTGAVYIYNGSATGTPMMPTTTLTGVGAQNRFGSAVNTAGDVNGDGFSDLVIGASAAGPGGRTNAGSAGIYHGSATGVSMMPSRLLEGAAAQDNLGTTALSAGDVNGDGYSDVIIGAPGADPGGRMNAGVLQVFHGSAMGVPAMPSRTLEGTPMNGGFGYSVAAAGDTNGDGFADVAVGFNYAPNGMLARAGNASVFNGSAMGLPMMPTRVLVGSAQLEEFGATMAGIGDVNGDGFGDLAVTSNGARANARNVSVFQGSATGFAMMATRVLEGQNQIELFGTFLAQLQRVPTRRSRAFSQMLLLK